MEIKYGVGELILKALSAKLGVWIGGDERKFSCEYIYSSLLLIMKFSHVQNWQKKLLYTLVYDLKYPIYIFHNEYDDKN